MVKKVVKRLFPPGTLGFRTVRAAARALRLLPPAPKGDIAYAEWIQTSEPFTWNEAVSFAYEPLISIVVPVFNAPDHYLLPMIDSVLDQKYQNWELLLINASADPACRQLTEDAQYTDTRIRIVDLPENKGIARNTNEGLAASKGEYVALLDHDDLLAPHALSEIVILLQGEPARRPQFIYSDEDKLSEDGEYRFDPHFKPDWSPHLLEGVNYLNHFTVMSRDLLQKVQGFRTGFDGAQDFDLYLRILDHKPRTSHVPKVLYHWRAARGSTAQNFSTKKGITTAGERALQEHYGRRKRMAQVKAVPKKPGFYRTMYELPRGAKGTIIVFPARNIDQQNGLIESLVKSCKTNNEAEVEFIIPASSSKLAASQKHLAIKTIAASDSGQTFLERALTAVKSDFVIGINAAVLPKTKDWIDRLGGLVCQDEEVGIATPMLIDKASQTLLDAGYIKQYSHLQPLFERTLPGNHTYFGNTDWARDVQSISGRVWAARTDRAKKYGKTGFPVSYQSIIDDGLYVVFSPYVRMEYYGELFLQPVSGGYFNNNLQLMHGQTCLPRSANIPEQRSKD